MPAITMRDDFPLDSGWAWMVALGYFGTYMCLFGISKSGGLLIEEIQDYFMVSTSAASLLMTVAYGVFTVISPIAPLLGTRMTARAVVMAGGFIGFLGMSLASLCYSIHFVILTFAVAFGVGSSCLMSNSDLMLSAYFQKRRTLAFSLASTGSGFGQFLFPALLEFFIQTYTIKGAFLLTGALFLHVLPCGALYRPLPESIFTDPVVSKKCAVIIEAPESFEIDDDNKNSLPGSSADSVFEANINASETCRTVVQLLGETHQEICDKRRDTFFKCRTTCKGNLTSIVVAIFGFLFFFGYFGFVTFVPIVATAKGMTGYEKAILVCVPGGSEILGRLIVGYIGNRKYMSSQNLILIQSLITAGNVIIFTHATTFGWLCLHTALYGLCGGPIAALVPVMVAECVGLRRMPKAIGLVNMSIGASLAAAPYVLGLIMDATGTYGHVLYFSAFMMIAATCVLGMYPVVRRFDSEYTSTVLH